MSLVQRFSGLFLRGAADAGDALPEFRVDVDMAADSPEDPAREPPDMPHQQQLEGQSFALDYVNRHGGATRRRVTAWATRLDDRAHRFLVAKCHERGEDVAFRMDRIRAVIDLDGVPYSPPQTFFEHFLDIHDVGGALATDVSASWERFNAMRSGCRDGAKLLMAIAASDGYVHRKELDAIMRYCDGRCRDAGLDPGPAEMERLRKYVQRLHPTRADVEKALSRIGGANEPAQRALLRGCLEVIEADGEIDPAEVDLLRDIAKALGHA